MEANGIYTYDYSYRSRTLNAEAAEGGDAAQVTGSRLYVEGAVWKIPRVDGVERVKALVPCGTPVQ